MVLPMGGGRMQQDNYLVVRELVKLAVAKISNTNTPTILNANNTAQYTVT